MKTIVIYKSKTGFTKMYATAISERLNCELVTFHEAKKRDLSDYDCIIYGGGIMANRIYHIDKLNNLVHDQKLILFAVGLTSQNATEVIQRIKEENLRLLGRDVDFYYFEGGVDYDKLGFMARGMLKMIYNTLSKKEDRSEEDEMMMNALSASCNHVHLEYIEDLLDHMKI